MLCSNNTDINFQNYIQQFKVKKGCDFTHTSLDNPSGSFYIPSSKLDEFHDIYADAITDDNLYSMTEKHTDNLYSPILIDFDFRYPKKDNLDENGEFKRLYDMQNILDAIKIYINSITKYIDFFDDNGSHIYVFNKKYPSISNDPDIIKDGIHIVIPDINVKQSVQLLARDKCLNKLSKLFSNLGYINSIEDIFDKSVIDKNNWLMFSSTKPNSLPYILKKVYNCKYVKDDNDDFILSFKDVKNDIINFDKNDRNSKKNIYKYLTSTLSIRNKAKRNNIKNKDAQKIIKKYEDKILQEHKNKLIRDQIINTIPSKIKNKNIDFKMIEKFVLILDIKRADVYNDWIRLGWCLHNIDYRLLNSWITFSRMSTKYKEGQCEFLWNRMKPGKLNIGTLRMWAKKDNEAEYDKIIKDDLNKLVKIGRSGTHTDIANIIHKYYKNEFVCSNVRNNIWYYFNNHRWNISDSGVQLRKLMSTKIVELFQIELDSFRSDLKDIEDYDPEQNYDEQDSDDDIHSVSSKNSCSYSDSDNDSNDNSDSDDDQDEDENEDDKKRKQDIKNKRNEWFKEKEQKKLDKIKKNQDFIKRTQRFKGLTAIDKKDEIDKINKNIKDYQKVIKSLKTSTFKTALLKECTELFYIEKFEEKLDTNKELLGFTNGVLDLQTMEFRDGHADDFISLSTKISYHKYQPHKEEKNKIYNQIFEFIQQIQPDKHMQQYLLKTLGSYLTGNIKEHRLHLFNGEGSNGKSKIIELFQECMGEYAGQFSISLLTNKRCKSNEANPEVSKAVGRRFMVMQEPGDKDKLEIGYMKELTGGDRLQARGLYKDPIEFYPQFHLAIICNHLPNINSDDPASWRRLKVVDFPCKFCDDPNPDNPFEFKIDCRLGEKFDVWKEHFMSILVYYYKKYMDEGIFEPEQVQRCTKMYQYENDIFKQYSTERLIFKESSEEQYNFLDVNQCYEDFKYWHRDSGHNAKLPSNKNNFIKSMDKVIGKHTTLRNSNVKGWDNYILNNSFDGSDTSSIHNMASKKYSSCFVSNDDEL
jgi:P4 family phage/plasmid primase-like protien